MQIKNLILLSIIFNNSINYEILLFYIILLAIITILFYIIKVSFSTLKLESNHTLEIIRKNQQYKTMLENLNKTSCSQKDFNDKQQQFKETLFLVHSHYLGLRLTLRSNVQN